MKNHTSINCDKTELCFIRITVESLTLTYRLFEERIEASGNSIFSISLTSDDPEEHDETYVPFISLSRQEAERIFEMICRGCVTPCTVCDILEDLKE